ncbi:hypothetical protein MYX04_01220 [Nitrospiraceae bacterium AH_259_D15_M11_P09]|nr:hypothetical protein [Nitrospiraceae bacterium AH_259_D15_M11_P09]
MFSFDPKPYKGELVKEGWLFFPNGCSRKFLERLESFTESLLGGEAQDEYAFIPDHEELKIYFTTLQILTGNTDFTMCRNHVSIYKDVEGDLLAHKDRHSLRYSCGIGIRATPQSRLLLWPDAPRDINMHPHYKDYEDAYGGYENINKILKSFIPKSINLQRGDVILFLGDEVFHQRTNPNGVVMYYLTSNTLGVIDRAPNRYERA